MDGIPVFYCHRVKCSVVLYEPEAAVLLFNEENRRCHRRFGGPDPAGRQSLLDEGVELLLFEGRDRVDLAVRGLRVRDELDGVIPGSALQQGVKRLFAKNVRKFLGPSGDFRRRRGRILGEGFGEPLRDCGAGSDILGGRRRLELSVENPVAVLDGFIRVSKIAGVIAEKIAGKITEITEEITGKILGVPIVTLAVRIRVEPREVLGGVAENTRFAGVQGSDLGERLGANGSENSGCGLCDSAFGSDFVAAGGAGRRAPAHLDLLGVPVNLPVVLPEPGVPKDELLLAQPRDCELDSLRMPIVAEDNVGDLPDSAGFVRSTVYIINRDGSCQPPEREADRRGVLRIDKFGGRSAVHQSVDREFKGALGGLYLQGQVQRINPRGRHDGVALGEPAFPLGSSGLRGGVSAIFGAFGVSEGGAGGLGASLVSGVQSNKSSHSLYKHPKRLWDANEGAPLTRRGRQNPPIFPGPPRPPVSRRWSRAERLAPPANRRRAAELLRPARLPT